jgi:hypothetical protein
MRVRPGRRSGRTHGIDGARGDAAPDQGSFGWFLLEGESPDQEEGLWHICGTQSPKRTRRSVNEPVGTTHDFANHIQAERVLIALLTRRSSVRARRGPRREFRCAAKEHASARVAHCTSIGPGGRGVAGSWPATSSIIRRSTVRPRWPARPRSPQSAHSMEWVAALPAADDRRAFQASRTLE